METINSTGADLGGPLSDSAHRFTDASRELSTHQHAGHHGHDHDHDHDHERARAPRVKRDMSHIQGWGADLDHKNRPGVPMERTPPRLEGAPLAPPAMQPQHIEVFVSPERPARTPLFGTGAPPKGLSGLLRRIAYKSTENDVRHWLLLLLADRVNVVEGLGEDLMHGKVPNVLAEMGIKAEWEHNRAGLVRKAVVATAVAGAAWYLLKGRDSRQR